MQDYVHLYQFPLFLILVVCFCLQAAIQWPCWRSLSRGTSTLWKSLPPTRSVTGLSQTLWSWHWSMETPTAARTPGTLTASQIQVSFMKHLSAHDGVLDEFDSFVISSVIYNYIEMKLYLSVNVVCLKLIWIFHMGLSKEIFLRLCNTRFVMLFWIHLSSYLLNPCVLTKLHFHSEVICLLLDVSTKPILPQVQIYNFIR